MLEHIQTIWKLLGNERKIFGAAIGSLILASFFLYSVPFIPQAVMDGVLPQPKSGVEPSSLVQNVVHLLGGRSWLLENLWFAACTIIFLSMIAGLFTYLRGRLAAFATERIIRRLRDQIFDHLQHLPARFFEKSETGDLVQRCTSDVETIRLFLSTQITEIGRALIMFFLPLPFMFALSPSMTWASIAFIPFIAGFSFIFFVRIQNVFRETDEAEGKLTAVLQENLTGIRVVRAFARQDFESTKFDACNARHRYLHNHLYLLLSKFWAISDLLCFLQKGLVLGVGVFLLSQGSLGVGGLYFFLAVVYMFLWPVRMMGRILTDVGKALVAIERIYAILDTQPESMDSIKRVHSSESIALSFEDVSFSYHPDADPVLRHISFAVQPGQTLAIVGPSGSGKSSILRLITRLYSPTSGEIRVGKRSWMECSEKELRSQMAIVMQNPFLYSKSIEENIKIARADATHEDVVRVAQMACVHHSISSFEQQYETSVGEQGVTLSGGQRQRIAIARALLQDAPLLLLDDAMSAVDTQTEQSILSTLHKESGKRTTILVAHRLSTVQHADQILVLREGQITQSGTHQELLSEDGWYRSLWNIQSAVAQEGEHDARSVHAA